MKCFLFRKFWGFPNFLFVLSFFFFSPHPTFQTLNIMDNCLGLWGYQRRIPVGSRVTMVIFVLQLTYWTSLGRSFHPLSLSSLVWELERMRDICRLTRIFLMPTSKFLNVTLYFNQWFCLSDIAENSKIPCQWAEIWQLSWVSQTSTILCTK